MPTLSASYPRCSLTPRCHWQVPRTPRRPHSENLARVSRNWLPDQARQLSLQRTKGECSCPAPALLGRRISSCVCRFFLRTVGKRARPTPRPCTAQCAASACALFCCITPLVWRHSLARRYDDCPPQRVPKTITQIPNLVKSKRCNTCASPALLLLQLSVTIFCSYGFTPAANAAAGTICPLRPTAACDVVCRRGPQ